MAGVRDGSIAARLGLRPGDRVLRVGGRYLSDYIDYRYLTAEPVVELAVVRRDGTEVIYEVEKDIDEDLGLEFAEDIFGPPAGPRTCCNRCVFCFVDRLPSGLRPSLYVKDDDYRLSFLHGNFITLTNLKAEDFDRILSLRLSPLYVSVHSTEPEVRRMLLGNSQAGQIMDQLARLVRGGITVHAQVVVCPGLNDGPHLDRTIADLAALRPGVASVGVVPVGLTAFGPSRTASAVRPATAAEKQAALETVLSWHQRLGGFVYPADEYFLDLGSKLPPAVFYDGYPQLANGIGLARSFLDDLGRLERRLRRATRTSADQRRKDSGPDDGASFTVVTGRLARPLLESAVPAVGRLVGRRGEILEVPNSFFGPEVTVAGLLTGSDLVRAVRSSSKASGPVLVPAAALRAGTDELLDGWTLAALAGELGRPFLEAGWLPSHMAAALQRTGGG